MVAEETVVQGKNGAMKEARLVVASLRLLD